MLSENLFILLFVVLLPLCVSIIVGWKFYNDIFCEHDVMGIILIILFTLTVLIIMLFVGCIICGLAGLGAYENDSLFNNVPQEFSLNGVDFIYTDNRYIDITLPAEFYGRVSVINTDTRNGLFSVSISKNEIYSKNIVELKKYRIDTAYSGTNQFTIEVENKERYESHVYTIKNIKVRLVDSGIFCENRNVNQVLA